MRVAVFGTGAVGGYFGARLAQAGHEIAFVARGEHLQKIRNSGLKVDSLAGDFVVQPTLATDKVEDIGAVDFVLLGVKAWQVEQVAAQMQPLMSPTTAVVPLQNGVDAVAGLSASLGGDHVLGGLCKLIAYLVGPGHLRHAGADPVITFGELDDRKTDRVLQLQAMFNESTGVSAEVADDINVELWKKFMLIAAWSGLGAVTRSPVGIFRGQPETRRLLVQVLEEVRDVARARSIEMPSDCVESCLNMFDSLPADGTASMQRDIIAGVRSELDQQNGAVVRLGQEVGVATPANAFIYSSLLPMERRARGKLQFS